MKYCIHCGKELVDEAVVCINCGCSVGSKAQAAIPTEEDTVSVGLCFLSAFLPIFGIIYWAVKSKDTPRKAKACGMTAIITWVASIALSALSSLLSVAIYVVYFVIYGASLFAMFF